MKWYYKNNLACSGQSINASLFSFMVPDQDIESAFDFTPTLVIRESLLN